MLKSRPLKGLAQGPWSHDACKQNETPTRKVVLCVKFSKLGVNTQAA